VVLDLVVMQYGLGYPRRSGKRGGFPSTCKRFQPAIGLDDLKEITETFMASKPPLASVEAYHKAISILPPTIRMVASRIILQSLIDSKASIKLDSLRQDLIEGVRSLLGTDDTPRELKSKRTTREKSTGHLSESDAKKLDEMEQTIREISSKMHNPSLASTSNPSRERKTTITLSREQINAKRDSLKKWIHDTLSGLWMQLLTVAKVPEDLKDPAVKSKVNRILRLRQLQQHWVRLGSDGKFDPSIEKEVDNQDITDLFKPLYNTIKDHYRDDVFPPVSLHDFAFAVENLLDDEGQAPMFTPSQIAILKKMAENIKIGSAPSRRNLVFPELQVSSDED